MNLSLLTPDIVRFNIWNLLHPVSGHYTFYYNIRTNKYLLRQMGDYCGISTMYPVAGQLREPTAKEKAALAKPIKARLYTAYHYDASVRHSEFRPLMPGNESGRCGCYYVWPYNWAGLETPEAKAYVEEAIKRLT